MDPRKRLSDRCNASTTNTGCHSARQVFRFCVLPALPPVIKNPQLDAQTRSIIAYSSKLRADTSRSNWPPCPGGRSAHNLTDPELESIMAVVTQTQTWPEALPSPNFVDEKLAHHESDPLQENDTLGEPATRTPSLKFNHLLAPVAYLQEKPRKYTQLTLDGNHIKSADNGVVVKKHLRAVPKKRKAPKHAFHAKKTSLDSGVFDQVAQ